MGRSGRPPERRRLQPAQAVAFYEDGGGRRALHHGEGSEVAEVCGSQACGSQERKGGNVITNAHATTDFLLLSGCDLQSPAECIPLHAVSSATVNTRRRVAQRLVQPDAWRPVVSRAALQVAARQRGSCAIIAAPLALNFK